MSDGRVRNDITVRLQGTAVAAFGLQFVFANPDIILVTLFLTCQRKSGLFTMYLKRQRPQFIQSKWPPKCKLILCVLLSSTPWKFGVNGVSFELHALAVYPRGDPTVIMESEFERAPLVPAESRTGPVWELCTVVDSTDHLWPWQWWYCCRLRRPALTLAVVVLLSTQQTIYDLGSGGTVVDLADHLWPWQWWYCCWLSRPSLTLAVVVLLLTQQTSFDLGISGTVVDSADQLWPWHWWYCCRPSRPAFTLAVVVLL